VVPRAASVAVVVAEFTPSVLSTAAVRLAVSAVEAAERAVAKEVPAVVMVVMVAASLASLVVVAIMAAVASLGVAIMTIMVEGAAAMAGRAFVILPGRSARRCCRRQTPRRLETKLSPVRTYRHTVYLVYELYICDVVVACVRTYRHTVYIVYKLYDPRDSARAERTPLLPATDAETTGNEAITSAYI